MLPSSHDTDNIQVDVVLKLSNGRDGRDNELAFSIAGGGRFVSLHHMQVVRASQISMPPRAFACVHMQERYLRLPRLALSSLIFPAYIDLYSWRNERYDFGVWYTCLRILRKYSSQTWEVALRSTTFDVRCSTSMRERELERHNVGNISCVARSY